MTGIRCEYSEARDCCECNEPICLRHLRRKNDWDEEERSRETDE